MPERLGSSPSLCGNIAFRMFFLSHFLPSLSSDDWLPWGVKRSAALLPRVFLLGFRPRVIHSNFGFVGDIVSQRLANGGSPALSCFFAVAERTFGDVSKSKLNFESWILNSSLDLLSILRVCSVGVCPRCTADAGWGEV